MRHRHPATPHRGDNGPGGEHPPIDPDDFSDHEVPEEVDMSRSNPVSVAARAAVPVMQMESFSYHLRRFVARTRMHKRTQEHMKYTEYADHVTRDLCHQIDGLVPLWRKERHLAVPRTWWDHLKLDLFPKWAKTRWPVQYRMWDAEVILPMVPICNQDHMRIHFAIWRENPDAV